jgi:selenocysteine lyase/cysteine desulfurase
LLEGGTPNVLGISGLAAGVAWVAEQGPENLLQKEVALLERVVNWVRDTEGWRIAGRWDSASHVAALSLIVPDSLSPQDLAAILDTSFNIAIRPGLHCAPYVHRALQTFPQGTIRLSPGAFNTTDDVQSFIDALSQIAAVAQV